MAKILSVIIPTYNMEKYLQRCLDSLLIPHLEDIEVLIINDGSKDNSLVIARQYEAKYPESFRVYDKKNNNYGSCVNCGLKEITGKYVKILDADDYFEIENFDALIEQLKTIDCDLVITDYVVFDEADHPIQKVSYALPADDKLEFFEILPETDRIAMHAVTYKSSIFKQIYYHQTEGVSYTDEEWIFLPMAMVRSVFYMGKVIYKYLVGRSGQTVTPSVTIKNMHHFIVGIYNMIASYSTLPINIPDSNLSYLNQRLKKRIVAQYKKVLWLYYGKIDRNILVDFDSQLKQLNSSLYHAISDACVAKRIPFKYIKYWRCHQHLTGLTVFPFFVLHIMLRLHTAFRRLYGHGY